MSSKDKEKMLDFTEENYKKYNKQLREAKREFDLIEQKKQDIGEKFIYCEELKNLG